MKWMGATAFVHSNLTYNGNMSTLNCKSAAKSGDFEPNPVFGVDSTALMQLRHRKTPKSGSTKCTFTF